MDSGLRESILPDPAPLLGKTIIGPEQDGILSAMGDADAVRQLQPEGGKSVERGQAGHAGWWRTEPNVGRVAHGVPARVDRLRGLGNAVVPQVAEWIGRKLIECLR